MIGFDVTPAHSAAPPTPDPLATFFRPFQQGQVALTRAPQGGVTAWADVGEGRAACLRFDNNDPTTRLSWREVLVAELRNVYPVSRMALTGSWSQLQSSGSGRAGSYTGNRAVSTSSALAQASVTVNRAEAYDLWVCYTGRTGGGYVKVEIDGGQALVNEIGDPAALGFKAFSTYSATDLSRRMSVKVASGLTGSHDVRLSLGGSATPGGNQIMIEAFSITGALTDPDILPPVWEANTPYSMGDEVRYGGIYYAARANGQSGATPPAHLTGIASDGGLDWRADDRPTYPEFVAVDYPSEREYAARFSHDGTTVEVGGQTHGNETLVTRSILLDGQAWVPGDALSVGAEITILETTQWLGALGVPVADCGLSRKVAGGQVQTQVSLDVTDGPLIPEWFYVGMLPMVHWDGESATTVIDEVSASDAAAYSLSAVAGQTPADHQFGSAVRVGAGGEAMGQPLLLGLEAGITPSVPVSCFLRPNIDGRTGSGSLDWPAKAYVKAELASFEVGQQLSFFSRHTIRSG